MDIVRVNLEKKSYNIYIGSGIFEEAPIDFNYNKILIISDDKVPSEYTDYIYNLSGKKALTYIIKSGEDSKNINNYEAILDFMLTNSFTRNSLVIALGGGVVGDLAGFVASTFMRGVDFINIPTTFLSMVDSSSGGKTAINYKNVKNIFGTFYTPKAVYIDISFLRTLSIREFNAGLIEAIKMAMTFDENYYIKLKKYIKEVLYNEHNKENGLYVNIYNDFLVDIIRRSVELKKDTVEKDIEEKDLRRVLNFGHTLGHAIEEAGKSNALHGECVARGIYAITKDKIREDFKEIMDMLEIDIKYDFDMNMAINNLYHDKKGKDKDTVSVIKVDKIGNYEIVDENVEDLKEKLKDLA